MIALIGGGVLLLSIPSGPAAPATQPVRLETTASGDRVTFKVSGDSAVPFRGRYALTIVAGAGNRSTHAGSVMLTPNVPVTLSTVQVSVPPTGHWSATLSVEPDGGGGYSVTSAGR